MTNNSKIKKILDANIPNSRKLFLIKAIKINATRESFHEFRRYIHPKNKAGWFQKDAADNLQLFYEELQQGLRPKLVIEAPPQHGKSAIIVDFIAWLSGKNPDTKTIYTSFSDRLGVRANLTLQRLFISRKYKEIFKDTRIQERAARSDSSASQRNRLIVEYKGRDGCFRNTTVQGSITGETLDLGVIDDPIKGRKDANSTTVRNAAWDWFTDDFFTRFDEKAGLLCILTRWHVADPIGRLIESDPTVKVLKYKAIATEDEVHRLEGEALFPEHKSLGFLLERKKVMPDVNFSSLYQQSPYIQGGSIIKGEFFGRYTVLPQMEYLAVFGDTALKKKEHNDFQVAECWGKGVDGKLYLIDLLRDKFEAYELEKRFPDFWRKQVGLNIGTVRYFAIEDKASGTELIQRMKNTIKPKIPVKSIPRSIDKYTRVCDALGYLEAGYVMLPTDKPWVYDFISECEAFTADDAHKHDDQIDPMCDAISNMLSPPKRVMRLDII